MSRNAHTSPLRLLIFLCFACFVVILLYVLGCHNNFSHTPALMFQEKHFNRNHGLSSHDSTGESVFWPEGWLGHGQPDAVRHDICVMLRVKRRNGSQRERGSVSERIEVRPERCD